VQVYWPKASVRNCRDLASTHVQEKCPTNSWKSSAEYLFKIYVRVQTVIKCSKCSERYNYNACTHTPTPVNITLSDYQFKKKKTPYNSTVNTSWYYTNTIANRRVSFFRHQRGKDNCWAKIRTCDIVSQSGLQQCSDLSG